MRDVLAVARLGGRLFWRDGRAVGGVAVLGVCLGAGLPLLIAASLRSPDVEVVLGRRPDLNAPATIPFLLASALGAGAYGPFVTALLPGWVRWALDLLPTGAMVEIAGLAYRGGELATLTGPVLNLTVWALLALVAVRFLFEWDPRR